jgi:hypothetical protein
MSDCIVSFKRWQKLTAMMMLKTVCSAECFSAVIVPVVTMSS